MELSMRGASFVYLTPSSLRSSDCSWGLSGRRLTRDGFRTVLNPRESLRKSGG